MSDDTCIPCNYFNEGRPQNFRRGGLKSPKTFLTRPYQILKKDTLWGGWLLNTNELEGGEIKNLFFEGKILIILYFNTSTTKHSQQIILNS